MEPAENIKNKIDELQSTLNNIEAHDISKLDQETQQDVERLVVTMNHFLSDLTTLHLRRQKKRN